MDFKDKRILIVDDDPAILEAIADVLANDGYLVETTRSGGAALARLQRPPRPDLVLLDLFMPGMDGWTVVEQMRRLAIFDRVPVIAMTAGGIERWPDGVVERLRKPFPSGALEMVIERVLAEKNVA